MVIDLAFWGLAGLATSPAAKPFWDFLAPFSEDLLKDLLKDFVKEDVIKTIWEQLPLSARGRTVGRSLKAFVEAVQAEVDRHGQSPEAYVNPLKTLVKDREGAALLGGALNLRRSSPEAGELAAFWEELGVRSLPEGFDWARVAANYRAAVREIVTGSEELRAIVVLGEGETVPLLGVGGGLDPHLAEQGQALYRRQIRDRVETPELMGQIIAIDLTTADYAIDADLLRACARLKERRPKAILWAERIGYPAVYAVGGVLCPDSQTEREDWGVIAR